MKQLADRNHLAATYNKGHNTISAIKHQLRRFEKILDTGLEEAEADLTASEARLAAAVKHLTDAETVLNKSKI